MSAGATSFSFQALGTTATVAVTGPEALARAREVLERELDAIDVACSRFRPDSELTRLNAASGDEVAVSGLLLEAVRVALHAAEASGGLVDPTVGKTMRLVGYDRPMTVVRARDGRLFRPSFEPAAGWRKIELDEARGTVRAPKGVELDLGATAKALAADRAASAAARATGAGVLVSLGGDIAVAGEAPPGGWSIRIADDHAAPLDGPGPAVSVHSGGLASSGTTVRRWATARGELHHIVDPRTGRPADSPWRTVTVAAATCVDANTASTAALVLGESAPAWLGERRLPSRLVRLDGSVACVGAWPAEAA
ncbi:MAG TPA: FAD:protein FMN transferase [Gaiellaceae bacterium]|nr:FAD:protein FMN transferase [Gaiellaceae bacterium]